MTDRSDAERSSIDLDDFYGWVESTAEAEGTSPEAIVEQLMSTYWILNELTETLEETPYEHLLEGEASDSAASDGDSDDGPAGEVSKNEIVDVIKAIGELNAQPEPPAPDRAGGSIDPRLIEIIEALNRGSGGSGADGQLPFLTNRLDRIEDDVSSLDREVEDVGRRMDAFEEETVEEIDAVSDRVEDVEGQTESLETRLDSVAERHERELSTLRETVDWLEDALSKKANREAITDLRSLLETRDIETRERIDSVEGTFEEAYADIKQILAYLLDSSGEQGAILDVLVDTYESEIEEILDVHEDARRLREVKAAANRQGVGTAVCDACGESFDVSLLAEPRCPHCGRDIDRFESESGFLWRTTHVAKSGPGRPERGSRSVRERIQAALEDLEGSAGAAAGDRS